MGLLGGGVVPGLLLTVGGGSPSDAHLCPPGAQGWAQDRLCKASELNKLTVPQERGACLPAPWGEGGEGDAEAVQAKEPSWLSHGAPGHGGGFHKARLLCQFAAAAPPGPVIVPTPLERRDPLAFPVLEAPIPALAEAGAG